MLKKILIVDDEKIARERMQRFLKSYPEKLEAAEASNGPEALQMLREFQPQVVFLDIQMPEMSGFDVIAQIEKRNFQVIFQTAFDEFAIRAFEVNACDYLLKPYTEEKFLISLSRAFVTFDQREKLKSLEEHLRKSEKYMKSLVVKVGTQTKVIDISDIQYFKSEDHYTFAFSQLGESIIEPSLNFLTENLDPKIFFRSHRNCIVRKSLIVQIDDGSRSSLRLKSGVELPLSRESRKKILKEFKGEMD